MKPTSIIFLAIISLAFSVLGCGGNEEQTSITPAEASVPSSPAAKGDTATREDTSSQSSERSSTHESNPAASEPVKHPKAVTAQWAGRLVMWSEGNLAGMPLFNWEFKEGQSSFPFWLGKLKGPDPVTAKIENVASDALNATVQDDTGDIRVSVSLTMRTPDQVKGEIAYRLQKGSEIARYVGQTSWNVRVSGRFLRTVAEKKEVAEEMLEGELQKVLDGTDDSLDQKIDSIKDKYPRNPNGSQKAAMEKKIRDAREETKRLKDQFKSQLKKHKDKLVEYVISTPPQHMEGRWLQVKLVELESRR